MSETNVNAYKAELSEAVAEAKKALERVRDSADRLAEKQNNDADVQEAENNPEPQEDNSKEELAGDEPTSKQEQEEANRAANAPVPARPSTAGHKAPSRSKK